MKKVSIVDYGVGNILSVLRAFEVIGSKAELTKSEKDIVKADYLVLPGVGAFGDGMLALRESQYMDSIKEYMEKQRPFLGICLGMQMMLDESEEFGEHLGLGMIPGSVEKISDKKADGTLHKVPHIGWNTLKSTEEGLPWKDTIFKKLEKDPSVYFVHSYQAHPSHAEHRLADCFYNGLPISAAIQKDHFVGCQFHPEKSGPTGLKILEAFMEF